MRSLHFKVFLSFILRIYVCFCLFGFCICSECGKNPHIRDAGPLVETSTGTVIGKYVKDVAAFLGIPFAKPPLGDRRFAKSEPIQPWEGTLIAKKKPPSCMQYSSRNYPWVPSEKNSSENCLYLNVWVPMKCCSDASSKIPVLVWIHGGGFYAGSSNMEVYDGTTFASYGEVIVVSINYRLGVFGFLNGGVEGASGNAGLFDQLLALQWIKENIGHFGGDPSRITLVGESAGAMSISLHLVSPLSRGLFQKAIMQSGVAYHPHLVDESMISMFKAKTFADIVGCPSEKFTSTEIIDCLKNKDAFELAKAENLITSKFPVFFAPFFGNGNEFFDENPLKLIQTGNFSNLPTIIGNDNDEGAIFLTYVMPDVFSMNLEANLTLFKAKQIIERLFSTSPEVSSQAVYDFYFQNITQNGTDIIKAISNAYGDYAFNCPTMFFAEKLNDAYFYWNTHRSLKNEDHEWLGVTHFSEVPFVFGKPIVDSQNFTPDDLQFSATLIKKWENFARNGYPLSSESTQTWPKFSSSSPVIYELNSRCEGQLPHPRLEACEFWRPYIEVEFD